MRNGGGEQVDERRKEARKGQRLTRGKRERPAEMRTREEDEILGRSS